ncbi:hypothetical protein PCANC_04234 [Puccinia coronata f. sp. avenae]|uniref:DDE Tnp4 domain-containing protein n=2 Tax=Puccinia coronata f. sp. avenae TaxID=200324 RepID=A0A2N5VX87_9BASI|nr:hypothetical protein PCANC_04234 [Puccinia coronata f. sp. avenae]
MDRVTCAGVTVDKECDLMSFSRKVRLLEINHYLFLHTRKSFCHMGTVRRQASGFPVLQVASEKPDSELDDGIGISFQTHSTMIKKGNPRKILVDGNSLDSLKRSAQAPRLNLIMRKISERQEVIRELFMILFLLQLEETDRLVDSSLKMPLIPTIGSIISPNDAGKQLIIDLELEDSARVADLLGYVLSNRYLHDRLPARTRDEFDLEDLPQSCLLQQQPSISATHPSPASVDFGTAGLKRCETSDRRREISDVMKHEGFEGCVGFVDGTTIPLYQRPGRDGEVYWDRKKRYSINCQVICDCDKFITLYMTGWPGSCGDSFVFKKMSIHRDSGAYFDPGQYLLADSAYALSTTCIPAYKAPTANIPVNTEFNFCIARSRVRNEHTIGILKGRWASLQHLRLALNSRKDMKQIIRWINACIILHNLLSQLGDAWDELHDDMNNANQPSGLESASNCAEELRNKIQEKCIEFHYNVGTLPICL